MGERSRSRSEMSAPRAISGVAMFCKVAGFEEDEARMEEQEKRKRKAQEEEEARKEPRKEEATQGDQEPQPHHGDIRGEHHAASSDGTTRGAPPIAPKRFYVEQDSDEEPWPHLSQKKARV